MYANINIAVLLWSLIAFVLGTAGGFALRSRQLIKSRRRILELETEMVENHAEILRLHKIHSNRKEASEKVPVISLSHADVSSVQVKTKAKA